MDQDQIIQKIVEEVLLRMKSNPSDQTLGNQCPPTKSGETAQSSSWADSLLPSDLANYIDHTLLKPEASKEQIDVLCDEAAKYHFYSVCVNSSGVEYCVRKLGGTGVKTGAVVGFPLGAMDSRAKSFEARTAISNGASEIDMVLNVGAMKANDIKTVREDMLAVRRACRQGILLKVILETCLLTDNEKVLACQIAKDIGADFVKTSTGFNKEGATVADVALMRRIVGPKMGVKASGGIRSFEDAIKMLKAGANRLGTSASVAIVTAQKGSSNY